MKYLRRHTLTALLCCSPLPYDLFETGISKTVLLEVDCSEDEQVLHLKERQLTLDGTLHEHSFRYSEASQILEHANEALDLIWSCLHYMFMILSNCCIEDDKKGHIRLKLLCSTLNEIRFKNIAEHFKRESYFKIVFVTSQRVRRLEEHLVILKTCWN